MYYIYICYKLHNTCYHFCFKESCFRQIKSIFLSVGLLATHYVFIWECFCFIFIKNISLERHFAYGRLLGFFFFLALLKISFHCLLAFIFSNKSVEIQLIVPVKVICHFSLAVFCIFFFFFVSFQQFSRDLCLSVFFFLFN